MIGGLDSSFNAPTAAQADAAAAAGLRLWSGYIALPGGGIGLAAPWSQAEFDTARRCGSTPLGFCSGWDDPVELRAQAAAWRVRLCLDVEINIRDLGSWTQPWLDASGAGIYGRAAVHGLRAAFHVLALYPGTDPHASWSGPRPSDGTPCGWQWQGSHEEFGCEVDRGTYDDWFGGNMPITCADLPPDLVVVLYEWAQDDLFGVVDPTGQEAFADALKAGVTINSITDGWRTLPQAQAYAAARARLVAVEGEVDHLQTGTPAATAALQQLAADAQRVVADLQALAGGGPAQAPPG